MFKRFAKGRSVRRKPGEMNQTEAAYADHLEALKLAGEIQDYWFDTVTLRLAKLTRYTPDFLVMLQDDSLECHEVKGGFWEDDARVKIKVAAEHLPFRFIAVKGKKLAKKNGGGWQWDFETIGERNG